MQAESWISIIVAGLALAGVIYTGWSSRRQSDAEGTKSPYEALAARVAQLEESDRAKHAEIRCLRQAVDGRDDVIHALVEFVDSLGAWLSGGQRGKAPRPSDGLHDHIRTSYWHTDPDGIPVVPNDGQPHNLDRP